MFEKMRRKDREITKEEVDQILSKGDYGVLSTIGENGYPYGVAINYVYYNDKIYFHSATEGNKLRNIVYDKKVSFTVVIDVDVKQEQVSTNYKSVIAFGTAEEIDGDLKDKVLALFIHKYCDDFIDGGLEYLEKTKNNTKVIEINIDHMTGKARNL